MCTGKAKWFRAQKWADKEVKRGKEKGYLEDTAHSYKCDYCWGWHVTMGRQKRWI